MQWLEQQLNSSESMEKKCTKGSEYRLWHYRVSDAQQEILSKII